MKSDGIICDKCGGEGCDQCGQSGWKVAAYFIPALKLFCATSDVDLSDYQGAYRWLTNTKEPELALQRMSKSERTAMYHAVSEYDSLQTEAGKKLVDMTSKEGTQETFITNRVRASKEKKGAMAQSDKPDNDREWLNADGTCIICEQPEKEHAMQARIACRDEYARLAAELQAEDEIPEEEKAKVATQPRTKKAKAPSNGRAGRKALEYDGKTAVSILELAKGGKTTVLTFKNEEGAHDCAYAMWGLRRRHELTKTVAVSMRKKDKTVTIGPSNGKVKTVAKKATPAKKAAPKKRSKKS